MPELCIYYPPGLTTSQLILKWRRLLDPLGLQATSFWDDLGPLDQRGRFHPVELRRIQSAAWGLATYQGDPICLQFSQLVNDYTRVGVFTHGNRLDQIQLLRRYLEKRFTPVLCEAAWAQWDCVEAGPLLWACGSRLGIWRYLRDTYSNCRRGARCLKAIHRSLFPELEKLARIAPRYSVGAELLGDYLLIDFFASGEITPGKLVLDDSLVLGEGLAGRVLTTDAQHS